MVNSFFADEETDQKDKQPIGEGEAKNDEGKSAAIFAYVPFLCFIPLVKMRHNEFALKHGKQGLVLLFIEIVALLFLLIPKLGELFWSGVLILCVICAALGIFYVLDGKTWKNPIIGDFADKLKI